MNVWIHNEWSDTDKCHLHWNFDISAKMTIENVSIQKGVTKDINLSFNEHVSNLCQMASMKIATLARIFTHIDL